MIASPKMIAAFGVIAALALSHYQAYSIGYDASSAKHQAAARAETERMQQFFNKVTAANRAASEQIDALKATQSQRAKDAEHAAQNDHSACRTPHADSVQRLKTRWGAP